MIQINGVAKLVQQDAAHTVWLQKEEFAVQGYCPSGRAASPARLLTPHDGFLEPEAMFRGKGGKQGGYLFAGAPFEPDKKSLAAGCLLIDGAVNGQRSGGFTDYSDNMRAHRFVENLPCLAKCGKFDTIREGNPARNRGTFSGHAKMALDPRAFRLNNCGDLRKVKRQGRHDDKAFLLGYLKADMPRP